MESRSLGKAGDCGYCGGLRMTEPESLQARRQLLLEMIGQAADEIKMIDERLKDIAVAGEA